ncbi:hypothetical protein HWI79_371 [Cryptosporidium felis]|nr:hypothetical protein HWI79_371 [Cryptosporidium felis]
MSSLGSEGGLSSEFETPKRPRTDTAEAIFGDYWEAPKSSGFRSRSTKKIGENYKGEFEKSFYEKTFSDISLDGISVTNTEHEERLSFYESQGAESHINKYPTATCLFSRLKPKKWLISLGETTNSSSKVIGSGGEKRKNKKISSNLIGDDLPFTEIQFVWVSEIDKQKKVKVKNSTNSITQTLLTDPNDLSPIIINFPHPIQLQNNSIPYEVLDPRSVPSGSFIWWDRRVWEYNFVHMARRLSTNDEKNRKKLKLDGPLTPKKQDVTN